MERGEVEEAGRRFVAFLSFYGGHAEGFCLDALECGASFFFRGVPLLRLLLFVGCVAVAFCDGRFVVVGVCHHGVERHVAVERGEHPVGFGFEVVYLVLASHDEGERRGLHAAYGERGHARRVGAILECVETCGVHAQEPVAHGAA